MTRNDAKDFGRYLQTCRRSIGISLAVVSHQTKITVEILRKIENERLGQLPAPVFVKGFIRAFAEAVGAEPDEAVARLENHLAANNQLPMTCANTPGKTLCWYHVVLATAIFLAQIGATLYLAGWIHHLPPEDPQAQAEVLAKAPPPATEGLKIDPPHQAEKSPAPIESTPEPMNKTLDPVNRVADQSKISPLLTPSSDTLELRMTAVESTWLKVVSDDQTPREFLLQADQDVTLTAEHQFNLVIGNAGGIRVVLNDQPVPVVGTRGQVVALHLP